VSVVERVEQLSAKLQLRALGDWKIFEKAEIEVQQARVGECVSSKTAEMSVVVLKGRGVDVSRNMFGSRTTSAKKGITDLVGPIGTCASQGSVGPGVYSERHAGLCGDDARSLPTAKNQAHSAIRALERIGKGINCRE
jgi:hypothetical protein